MTEFKPTQLDKKWQQHWTATRAFEVAADPGTVSYTHLTLPTNREV